MPEAIDPPEFQPRLTTGEPFSDAEREAVYRAIYSRRDVRDQFRPDAVADDVLLRILDAAHRAPSVGLMQPWNFLVVRDTEKKRQVAGIFARANVEAAQFSPKNVRILIGRSSSRVSQARRSISA